MDSEAIYQHSARYQRQLQLPGFGPEAQQKLAAARVLVVGAGGLGVPVLQYLAGMGVGHLGILDGDRISLSNLHRQVLYRSDEVGQLKATVAQQKLLALNPAIQVEAWPEPLTVSNALEYICRYDLVVDATDSFAARYLINDACVILGKPFVYGSVHQYEGHVSVFHFQGGPTYRCLYPEPPGAAAIPDCNLAGVLGVVPGIIGCRQALEAVKMITGIGRALSGYLQIFDFLQDEQYRMRLKRNPANLAITALQESYEAEACQPVPKITPAALREWYQSGKPFQLIDVRTEAEYEAGHLPQAMNTPLDILQKSAHALSSDRPVILYCQRGGRSALAASLLRTRQPGLEVYELNGGLDNWQNIFPL